MPSIVAATALDRVAAPIELECDDATLKSSGPKTGGFFILKTACTKDELRTLINRRMLRVAQAKFDGKLQPATKLKSKRDRKARGLNSPR